MRRLADVPLDEYRADPRNFGSAERFLQLAIETTLNIGHHIIAASGFDQPRTYADVFRVLGKEGVLDAEFATALEPMADAEPAGAPLRGRGTARVHELPRTHLGDFDRFARAIVEHLAMPNDGPPCEPR